MHPQVRHIAGLRYIGFTRSTNHGAQLERVLSEAVDCRRGANLRYLLSVSGPG